MSDIPLHIQKIFNDEHVQIPRTPKSIFILRPEVCETLSEFAQVSVELLCNLMYVIGRDGKIIKRHITAFAICLQMMDDLNDVTKEMREAASELDLHLYDYYHHDEDYDTCMALNKRNLTMRSFYKFFHIVFENVSH